MTFVSVQTLNVLLPSNIRSKYWTPLTSISTFGPRIKIALLEEEVHVFSPRVARLMKKQNL